MLPCNFAKQRANVSSSHPAILGLNPNEAKRHKNWRPLPDPLLQVQRLFSVIAESWSSTRKNSATSFWNNDDTVALAKTKAKAQLHKMNYWNFAKHQIIKYLLLKIWGNFCFWENGAHLKFIFFLVPVSVDVDKLSLSGQSSLKSTFVKELWRINICPKDSARKTQFRISAQRRKSDSNLCRSCWHCVSTITELPDEVVLVCNMYAKKC